MSEAEALVAELAALSFAEHLDDPDALLDLLAERQRLLTALEQSDRGASLSEARRADLKVRLQAVLARDAELLETLSELREQTRKGLEQLASGRAAARGYGSASGSEPPSMRRIG